MIKVPFGDALREAHESMGLTQEAVGAIGYVSGKMISAIECGRRNAAPDTMQRITAALDNPRLYLEAAEEITGGVFATPWLDGDVDLHRTSVWAKVIEELEEAKVTVEGTKVINKKLDASTKSQVLESMIQVLDARVAIDHYISVMCTEYGFSVKEVFEEHKDKLQKKGYIKIDKKKSAR